MANIDHKHEAAPWASTVLRVAYACAIAVLLPTIAFTPLHAATRTATFNVTANIVSDCTIISIPNVDFGNIGVLNVQYFATSTVTIACTPGTAYTVGLDAGNVAGSTIITRLLSGPGGTITFSLFRDPGWTQWWGTTPGSDTVGGTGTGNNQSYTVYGRINWGQTTRSPGTYTTTITATVTY